MSVEKISVTTPIVNPLPTKTEEKTATPCAEPDKNLSDSAKLMIGATLLAGTIAIGIIGHKNNWWRKAVREGENLSGSANHNPHSNPEPVQPHTNPNNPQTPPQTPPHTELPHVEQPIIEHTPPTGTTLSAEQTAPKVEALGEVELPVSIKNIRTVEAATDEFNRIAAREIQELPANKAIIEEALAERSRFIVDNPTAILDADGVAYKIENSTITIMDKTGKPIKRMRFNIAPNEGWGQGLTLPPRPMLIEYINPETGKLTKIIKSDFNAENFSIRLFGDNEIASKELFYADKTKTLIVKDYNKAGNVPNKVLVFNIDDNTMKSCIEYNPETGYPSVAYYQGHIYTPRSNSTQYFYNIIESSPEQYKTRGLAQLYGCAGWDDIDSVMPRITKSGFIVEKGNINFDPHKFTLLDFATHERKYDIEISDNDCILREYDTKTLKQIKSLWIENGEIISNKFGKSPKEVLEEMKEIFADLTPDLYSESTKNLSELIQGVITKLN